MERLRLTSSPRVMSKSSGIREFQASHPVTHSPSILVRRRCKFGLPALLAVENLSNDQNAAPSVPMAPRSGPHHIILPWEKRVPDNTFLEVVSPCLSPSEEQ
jgi:hypothetical protein